MKTMTATQARQRLGAVLSRVLEGEDIGIVHSGSGKIIALRPVEVYSEDYALVEYGLNQKELSRAEKNILNQLKNEKPQRWDGTATGLRGRNRPKLETVGKTSNGRRVVRNQGSSGPASGKLR